MSSQPATTVDEHRRAATPPIQTTWAARQITIPNFSAFTPKNIRVTSSGVLTKVAWSCDGKRVIACGTEKYARIWTPDKSFDVRSLGSAHTDTVDLCAWSPTSPDLLCTASSKDTRVVFWDVKSRSPLQSISLKPKQPARLAYSPNGQVLAVVTKTGSIIFLALSTRDDGSTEWHVTNDKIKQNETEVEVCTVIWNHPGTAVIVGEKGGLLGCYRFPDSRKVYAAGAHLGGATSLALDPRGKYVATAGGDSIINLFDVRNLRISKCLDCTEDQVMDLDFSHDGEFIAVAYAKSLEIWATELGECIQRVTQPSTPCRSVAWHHTKFVLAYAGQSHSESGIRQTQPPYSTVSFFGV